MEFWVGIIASGGLGLLIVAIFIAAQLGDLVGIQTELQKLNATLRKIAEKK